VAFDWLEHDRQLLSMVWKGAMLVSQSGGRGVQKLEYRYKTLQSSRTILPHPLPLDRTASVDLHQLLVALLAVHSGAILIRDASGFGSQTLDYGDKGVVVCETTVREHPPRQGKASKERDSHHRSDEAGAVT